MQDEAAFEWRDTTLARQLADEKTVKTLLDWMLAGVKEREQDDDEEEDGENDSATSDETEYERQQELRTSSLVTSVAVLVDLIRKNNSDFVEQQMLAWARRKEAEALEREMLEADGARQLPLPGGDDSDDPVEDRGPSVDSTVKDLLDDVEDDVVQEVVPGIIEEKVLSQLKLSANGTRSR